MSTSWSDDVEACERFGAGGSGRPCWVVVTAVAAERGGGGEGAAGAALHL